MPEAEQTQTEAPPAETPEQEAPETEAPEAPPEQESTDPDSEVAEPGEEAPEGEGQEAKPEETAQRKRQGGWQRKIERLERDAAAKDQMIQQLVQRQGAPGQPGQPGKDASPEEKAAAYIQSLVDQQIARREAAAHQAKAAADLQARTSEVRARYADFDDALMSVDHIGVPPGLQQVLLTSPQGAEIMYQLAKNPAELARISALPPFDAAREIGRLEAKASSTAGPNRPKSASRPPAPPSTVNGTKKPTGSLEDLSLADYKRAYRSGRR